ncbi:element excision factor XisH family protein, partial [Nostoc punctiforme UO1]|uniref:element excision factor XisH family protein n=1 Tax=Nostoc punctiforme TaxID=272131 RepID=UPI003095F5F2
TFRDSKTRKSEIIIWAKYSLESKRNPEKRTAFKIKIAEYLKIEKESPERLQVWFWDESGFSLRVTRRKNWCKKGSRKKIRGDRSCLLYTSGPSKISQFYTALGQFISYRAALQQQETDRLLYLAVPSNVYDSFFTMGFIQSLIQQNQIHLALLNLWL